MLSAIGLDEGEESVYRLLVTLGAADLADLTRRLELDEGEVGRRLQVLAQRGLATRSSVETGGRWVAAPPGVALRPLLIQQRLELEQAEQTAAALAEEYRAEASESDADTLVEVVVGGAAVSQRFLQLQLGAEREVMAFVTDNPVAVSGPENEAEGVAVARGVTYRIVIERALLTSPEEFAEVSASLGRDVNIRVVDRVPTKLVVADGLLAMVPLSGKGSEPAALVIHASGLLESLSGLFESVWREATPLVLVGPGRAPRHDVVVLERRRRLGAILALGILERRPHRVGVAGDHRPQGDEVTRKGGLGPADRRHVSPPAGSGTVTARPRGRQERT